MLVVLGHVIAEMGKIDSLQNCNNSSVAIYNVIYLFHMPLYFMISGYVFNMAFLRDGKMKYKKLKYQIFDLCWNYFLWSAMFWGLRMIFGNADDEISTKTLLLTTIKSIGVYWYLYVLVFLYLISMLFVRLKNDVRILMILGMILVLLQFYILPDSPKMTVLVTLRYIFFFTFGRMLENESSNWSKRKIKITYIISRIVAIISVWYVVFNIKQFITWSQIPLVGGIFALSLSILCFFFMKYYGEKRILRWMSTIGKYGLEIYLLHYFVLIVFRRVISNSSFSIYGIIVLVNMGASLLIPMMMAMILQKCEVKGVNLHIIFRPSRLLRRKYGDG